MALSFSTADAVLKEDYKGPVVDLLNNGNILLAQVDRNTTDFSGRRWVAPLHTGRNSGVGARGENGTLPTAGNQSYSDTYGPVRAMYARIQLSGMIISAMGKDATSFIRALRPEMEGAVNDAKRDYCRQLWGTSDGKLATCGITAGSTTVTLDSGTRSDQLRAIAEGFLVDIGTAGSPTLRTTTSRTPSAVDFSAKTFVVSGAAITTAGTDFVWRAGAAGSSSNSGNPGDGQYELTGLQTMISDSTTLHTLAATGKWKARVNSNSGTARALSENLVNSELMAVEVESGGTVTMLIGSGGVFRSYANLLTAAKRFQDTVTLKGGYGAVPISTVMSGRQGAKTLNLTWDRDCPDKQLFGLSIDDFSMFELEDFGWMDRTGAVLIQVGDTDAYSATLRAYKEFVCRRRNSHFVIKDITEA